MTYPSMPYYVLAAREAKAIAEREKLGPTQTVVLRSLIEYGSWPGGGWIYGNNSTTMRVLDSLVKRGLVERTDGPRFPPSYHQKKAK